MASAKAMPRIAEEGTEGGVQGVDETEIGQVSGGTGSARAARPVPDDVCEEIEELIASNERFPYEWPVDDYKAMCALEQEMEHAVTTSLDTSPVLSRIEAAFRKAIPALNGYLQPLPGVSGWPECPTCQVSFDGPGCPLTPAVARIERLPTAWVFAGRAIFEAPVRKWRCQGARHSSVRRMFRPRGVAWTKATHLFPAQDGWFFAVSLLKEITRTFAEGRVPPSTAIRIWLQRSFEFMKAWAPELKLPDLENAKKRMYEAWYAFMWLTDFELLRWAICRYCGFFPKLGADACAKVGMNLSHVTARNQVRYPTEPLQYCKKCHQQLGSNGGFAMRFAACQCDICFGCLPDTWAWQAGLPLREGDLPVHLKRLRNSKTTEEDRRTSLAFVNSCLEEAAAKESWPGCPFPHRGSPKPTHAAFDGLTGRGRPKPTAGEGCVCCPAEPSAHCMNALEGSLPQGCEWEEEEEQEEEGVGEAAAAEEEEPTFEGPPAPANQRADGTAPQVMDGPTLWTQKQLWDHCGRHLLRLCYHGSNPNPPPIPVEKVPPIFQAESVYASDTLYNTSRMKGRKGVRNQSADIQGARAPTAAAVAPLLDLMRREQISYADLRAGASGEETRKIALTRWLCACGMAEATAKQMSGSQASRWLLDAWQLAISGKTACKMFTSAKLATGGTANFSCPHGIEVMTILLFTEEGTRDYLDGLRSLNPMPAFFMIDASCSVIAGMEANYPEESRKAWGDHRGTFRPFVTDAEIKGGQLPDLSPVAIPEFQESAIRTSLMGPNARKIAEYAKQVRLAKGDMRLDRHPTLTGSFQYRVIGSDRLHHSPFLLKRVHGKKQKPNSHKLPSCTQHLISICPDLRETRSNLMESLNSQKTRYLPTICTTDPVHHLVISEMLRRLSNRRIGAAQDEELAKSAGEGQKVVTDPDFGCTHIVCSMCEKSGHSAEDCDLQTTKDGADHSKDGADHSNKEEEVQMKREPGRDTPGAMASHAAPPQKITMTAVDVASPGIKLGCLLPCILAPWLSPAQGLCPNRICQVCNHKLLSSQECTFAEGPQPVEDVLHTLRKLIQEATQSTRLGATLYDTCGVLLPQSVLAWASSASIVWNNKASEASEAPAGFIVLHGLSSRDGAEGPLVDELGFDLALEEEAGLDGHMTLEISIRMSQQGVHAEEQEALGTEPMMPTLDCPHLTGTDNSGEPPHRCHLTDAETAQVHAALADGGREGEVLGEFENIPVTRYDMRTLRPYQWLNDEVINCLIKFYTKHFTSRRSVYVASTAFYTRLVGPTGYCFKRVRRWTRKVDVSTLDLVLVPIHMNNNHWTLAIIDCVKQCFTYYDSLGSTQQCASGIHSHLMHWLKDVRGLPTEPDYTFTCERLPAQENDCNAGPDRNATQTLVRLGHVEV